MAQINFRRTVSAQDSDTQTKESTILGTIKNVILHFPPGCNALVEVRVSHGTKQIVPREGYIALNDATPTFEVNEPINVGDSILVEIINHDSTYSHTISTIINISESPEEVGGPG